MEIWKKAVGYPTYEVSSLGRLKTFNWKNSGQTRIMKPALDNSGYLRTMLKDENGKISTVKVHRVILNTFNYRSDYKKYEVNHKDGDKQNNSIDNLEWVTRKENIQHCIDNNLQYVLKGEEIGNSILKEKDVIYIRSNFKPRVVTRKMLANKFNVSESTIKDILSRKSWKHVK